MAEETGVQAENAAEAESNQDYTGLTEAVRDLVDVMHKGELERLEVSHGDLHILLCARTAAPVSTNSSLPPAPAEPVNSPSAARVDSGNDQPWHQITSPMVGTFYEAPSPGEPPYVRPGDAVDVGQTVAIIEAMKIMNEIIADRPGVIDEILVENGEAVEFGHPLFRLRPA
jgi:acetyl-CoA carboxylase biotin carboxyl carrier protein